MKREELSKFKDKLQCCFCRNDLTNREMIIKHYEDDLESVWCEDCSKLPKQCEPKFLQCLCGDKPKELDIEMAKSEIKVQKEEEEHIDYNPSPELLKTLAKSTILRDDNEESKTSFKPRSKRKVSNL